MECRASISRNLARLRRIAFEFFAMAGFDGMNPPEPIARGKYGMPRQIYNAVMALLRPAEAATRRLIIAMAETSRSSRQSHARVHSAAASFHAPAAPPANGSPPQRRLIAPHAPSTPASSCSIRAGA